MNVGCGPRSRWLPNSDGIDILDFGQEYVGSILTFDIPREYATIYCHHVVEHISDTVLLMNRLWSILKDDGLLDIRVPVYPSQEAFQDPTHVKFIPGRAFFSYFTDESPAGYCYSVGSFSILKCEHDRFPWELHIVMQKRGADHTDNDTHKPSDATAHDLRPIGHASAHSHAPRPRRSRTLGLLQRVLRRARDEIAHWRTRHR